MTSAWRARPLSSMPAARLSAATKPVHAAPTSNAWACGRPSASATSGAAFGMTSSAVVVATRTRSTSSSGTLGGAVERLLPGADGEVGQPLPGRA